MLERERFHALVKEIESLGYSEKQACDFAMEIGDTPEVDEQGRVVVRDEQGRELARLALKFFGD